MELWNVCFNRTVLCGKIPLRSLHHIKRKGCLFIFPAIFWVSVDISLERKCTHWHQSHTPTQTYSVISIAWARKKNASLPGTQYSVLPAHCGESILRSSLRMWSASFYKSLTPQGPTSPLQSPTWQLVPLSQSLRR